MLVPTSKLLLVAITSLLPIHGISATEACRLVHNPAKSAKRIPIQIVDGRIYVEADVNGKGLFRFAVDTGASGFGRLDKSVLPRLQLEKSGITRHSDGVQSSDEDTTRISSLALGDLVKTDIPVMTRDYKARLPEAAWFDGILARDFFADGTLIVNYSMKELIFSTETHLTGMEPDVAHYDRAFRIPIHVDGKVFEANIDTGANVAMVVPKRLWEAVSNMPLATAGAGTLSNSTIQTERGIVPGPVRLGAVTLADINARVSDRVPEIMVGAYALKDSILAIDQRSHSIAICPVDGK